LANPNFFTVKSVDTPVEDPVSGIYVSPLGLVAARHLLGRPVAKCENVLKMAKKLVSLKAAIDSRASNGQTPLAIACEAKNLELVDYFLSLGCNGNIPDERGWSPACAAVSLMGVQAERVGRKYGELSVQILEMLDYYEMSLEAVHLRQFQRQALIPIEHFFAGIIEGGHSGGVDGGFGGSGSSEKGGGGGHGNKKRGSLKLTAANADKLSTGSKSLLSARGEAAGEQSPTRRLSDRAHSSGEVRTDTVHRLELESSVPRMPDGSLERMRTPHVAINIHNNKKAVGGDSLGANSDSLSNTSLRSREKISELDLDSGGSSQRLSKASNLSPSSTTMASAARKFPQQPHGRGRSGSSRSGRRRGRSGGRGGGPGGGGSRGHAHHIVVDQDPYNANDKPVSPLCVAVKFRNFPAVQLLLALPNVRVNSGHEDRVFFEALRHQVQHPEHAQILMNGLVLASANPLIQDQDGCIPLWCASGLAREQLVHYTNEWERQFCQKRPAYNPRRDSRRVSSDVIRLGQINELLQYYNDTHRNRRGLKKIPHYFKTKILRRGSHESAASHKGRGGAGTQSQYADADGQTHYVDDDVMTMNTFALAASTFGGESTVAPSTYAPQSMGMPGQAVPLGPGRRASPAGSTEADVIALLNEQVRQACFELEAAGPNKPKKSRTDGELKRSRRTQRRPSPVASLAFSFGGNSSSSRRLKARAARDAAWVQGRPVAWMNAVVMQVVPGLFYLRDQYRTFKRNKHTLYLRYQQDLLGSALFQICMFCIVLFVLYAKNVCIHFAVDGGLGLDISLLAAAAAFLFEVVLQINVVSGYPSSLYFLCDLLGIAAIYPDTSFSRRYFVDTAQEDMYLSQFYAIIGLVCRTCRFIRIVWLLKIILPDKQAGPMLNLFLPVPLVKRIQKTRRWWRRKRQRGDLMNGESGNNVHALSPIGSVERTSIATPTDSDYSDDSRGLISPGRSLRNRGSTGYLRRRLAFGDSLYLVMSVEATFLVMVLTLVLPLLTRVMTISPWQGRGTEAWAEHFSLMSVSQFPASINSCKHFFEHDPFYRPYAVERVSAWLPASSYPYPLEPAFRLGSDNYAFVREVWRVPFSEPATFDVYNVEREASRAYVDSSSTSPGSSTSSGGSASSASSGGALGAFSVDSSGNIVSAPPSQTSSNSSPSSSNTPSGNSTTTSSSGSSSGNYYPAWVVSRDHFGSEQPLSGPTSFESFNAANSYTSNSNQLLTYHVRVTLYFDSTRVAQREARIEMLLCTFLIVCCLLYAARLNHVTHNSCMAPFTNLFKQLYKAEKLFEQVFILLLVRLVLI